MRHARPEVPSRAARARRHAALVSVAGALVLAAVTGTASAKETAGGTPAAPAACSPITSLGYKGDPRVGETGLSTVTVSYAVKPCVPGQSVTVAARVFLSTDQSIQPYDESSIPLSGKFVAVGITPNTSYTATITVTDTATGAVVDTRSIFVAAKTKPV
jgi:hypothetical protein